MCHLIRTLIKNVNKNRVYFKLISIKSLLKMYRLLYFFIYFSCLLCDCVKVVIVDLLSWENIILNGTELTKLLSTFMFVLHPTVIGKSLQLHYKLIVNCCPYSYLFFSWELTMTCNQCYILIIGIQIPWQYVVRYS